MALGWDRRPLFWLQEKQEAWAQGSRASRFGPMASSFSAKDERGVVWRDRRKYELAISENRKMNFLGKAGRLARHGECQFEVCGHEFKEQPLSRAVCFPPALFSCLAQAWRSRRVGFFEGWDFLTRFTWWGKGPVY